jgi:hypothetical protein
LQKSEPGEKKNVQITISHSHAIGGFEVENERFAGFVYFFTVDKLGKCLHYFQHNPPTVVDWIPINPKNYFVWLVDFSFFSIFKFILGSFFYSFKLIDFSNGMDACDL